MGLVHWERGLNTPRCLESLVERTSQLSSRAWRQLETMGLGFRLAHQKKQCRQWWTRESSFFRGLKFSDTECGQGKKTRRGLRMNSPLSLFNADGIIGKLFWATVHFAMIAAVTDGEGSPYLLVNTNHYKMFWEQWESKSNLKLVLKKIWELHVT